MADKSTAPLAGIKVIDWTQVQSGPSCTQDVYKRQSHTSVSKFFLERTPLAVSSQLHWKCALSKPLCKMNQT